MNALLIGSPDYLIKKLQLIQNNAARVVAKKRKHYHITPTLESIHWLPVAYRIVYKVLLLTHKCIIGKAPAYLSELLHNYEPGKDGLRSAKQQLLEVKTSNGKTYGNRPFSVAAPSLWNELPGELRKCVTTDRFKSMLKTYLFKKAFDV